MAVLILRDRTEAGEKLAELLKEYRGDPDTVVVSLPRGGVAVGAVIARELRLPHDIVVPRKIAHPSNPEYAYGAMAEDGNIVWGEEGEQRGEWVKNAVENERAEAARRLKLYRGEKGERNFSGKRLLVVDDGVATGLTMEAAIKSLRRMNPKELIIAVPHGAIESLDRLRTLSDRVVVLFTPPFYGSVGSVYESFDQTSDEEVVAILKRAP